MDYQKQEGRQIESNSIVKYVQGMMLEKYPNQRILVVLIISEEPITNFTALEMPPKGFPIVQFDMHVADIGLKIDILSQRGLEGTIDEAVKIIEKTEN
jgi:DNA polymerase-3 subunit alpha/error-prone DNA polymerase